MTKQEEIREWVKEWVLGIRQYLNDTEHSPEPFTKPIDPNVLIVEFPNKLLKYLHSQGVVIKVERELPFADWITVPPSEIAKYTQQNMLKAGYKAVEPLIKEG